jgi:hypothetical protein
MFPNFIIRKKNTSPSGEINFVRKFFKENNNQYAKFLSSDVEPTGI